MANEIFLNFFSKSNDTTPAFKGESTAKGHVGEIRANSLTWGYDQHSSAGSATSGAGAGKVEFGDLVFTKTVDSVSPAIYQALAAGTTFAKVIVTIRKATGAELAVFTLGLAAFTSLRGTADSGEDTSEEIGLAYGKAVWQAAKPDGKMPAALGWNRVTNVAITDLAK